MENEITIGSFGLSVVLFVVLGWIYNTFNVPQKWKPSIAPVIGILMALAAMISMDIAFTAKSCLAYGVQGFMAGAGAVGIKEITKKRDS
jgi:predicted membrane channel-forming protein YqfA (hemolysin III family)